MGELESLLDCLSAAKVKFVVVGGFAAVAHGVTLLTQDIDICCEFSWDNLARLQSSLSDLHPVHRMTPSRLPLSLTDDQARSLQNLYLDTDMGQLDCLSEVTGLGPFDEAMKQSIGVALGDHTCRVLSIDALIRAKEAMNRPRDREAVLQLKAIRERQQRDS